MIKSSILCFALATTFVGCSKPEQAAAPGPSTPAVPAPAVVASGKQNPVASAPQDTSAITGTAVPAISAANGVKPVALADLSSDQVTNGLKEALGNGLRTAVAQLGKPGGFLGNPNVKIPMPDKLQSVETTLRAIGQGGMADQFVKTMNDAAEQAVPAAANVFADSLNGMSVDDAKKILSGPNDAATQYFRHATEADLTAKFLPIVKQATANSGATAAYKQIMDKAKAAGPFFNAPSLDLDTYVTGKAMDGLFKMVAGEEKRIRDNPLAQNSDLIKSVFGALKK
jgi:hypothetical protein